MGSTLWSELDVRGLESGPGFVLFGIFHTFFSPAHFLLHISPAEQSFIAIYIRTIFLGLKPLRSIMSLYPYHSHGEVLVQAT